MMMASGYFQEQMETLTFMMCICSQWLSVIEQASNIYNVHFPGTYQSGSECAVLSTHSRHHPEHFMLMLLNTAAQDAMTFVNLLAFTAKS